MPVIIFRSWRRQNSKMASKRDSWLHITCICNDPVCSFPLPLFKMQYVFRVGFCWQTGPLIWAVKPRKINYGNHVGIAQHITNCKRRREKMSTHFPFIFTAKKKRSKHFLSNRLLKSCLDFLQFGQCNCRCIRVFVFVTLEGKNLAIDTCTHTVATS